MGWKNWPYWVRGGIIAELAVLLQIGFSYTSLANSPLNFIFVLLFLVPGLIFWSIVGDDPGTLGSKIADNLFGYSLFVIWAFLIGALIGLIVRKIKSRNKKAI